MNWRAVLIVARTLAIGLAGSALAIFIGVPAGWLSGAMIVVTVAAIGGLEVRVPASLTNVVFVVLGALLGAGISPQVVADAASWPLSLAGLMVGVAAMVFAVYVFLTRVARWDRATALFAAIPGALSYVVAIASTTGADLRRVAIGQSIRIFLLVVAIPALVSAIEPTPEPVAGVQASLLSVVVLLFASTAGALVFAALRVPAGLLTGALFVSGVLHATGLMSGMPPQWLTVAAYVVLGAMIGCRFAGTDLRLLGQIFGAAFGAFLIALAVAALSAVAVSLIVPQPPTQVLLAFAPGGLQAMTAMALALQMDSAFVAVHQLARFIAIAVSMPIVTRVVLGRAGKSG